jgi:hypothetical protein
LPRFFELISYPLDEALRKNTIVVFLAWVVGIVGACSYLLASGAKGDIAEDSSFCLGCLALSLTAQAFVVLVHNAVPAVVVAGPK